MSDPAFHITKRLSNGLNPSVLTVRATELVDIAVRRSRCGRLQPSSYRRVTVVGMNEFDPPPVRQALRAVTEVYDSTLIQVVQLAFGSPAPHECRDCLNQETKLTLALPKCIYRTLALVFRSFVLGKFLRQSPVGRDQFIGPAEQSIQHGADRARRLAVPPQARRRHDARQIVERGDKGGGVRCGLR